MRQARDDNGQHWTLDTLHEHLVSQIEALQHLVDERDEHYKERAVAQKESVDAAFAASEKAIEKSDAAQNSYNTTHNDLARKMDAQYQTMIPRTEARTMFDAIGERIGSLTINMDTKLDTAMKEIASLRESRSEGGGRRTGLSEGWGLALGLVLATIAIVGAILAKR